MTGSSETWTDADLVTTANNPVTLLGDTVTVQVTVEAEGTSLGTTIGGDNVPVLSVTPKYLPKSVVGCRMAGVGTDLDWLKANCSEWEYFELTPASSTRGQTFFFSGVMNVTTDEAYDPFGTSAQGTPPTSFALFTGLSGEMFD